MQLGRLADRSRRIREVVIASVGEAKQAHALAVEYVDLRDVLADRARVLEAQQDADLALLVQALQLVRAGDDAGTNLGADRTRSYARNKRAPGASRDYTAGPEGAL